MGAPLADHLVGELATKMVLNCLLFGRLFDCCFEAVHEHLHEFFRIHLLKNVDWLALPVLEGVAESFWIDVLFFTLEQSGEQQLELVEHVFVGFKPIVVWIVDLQHVLSEGWQHVQLLEEGDHVANAAEVLHAHVPSA